MTDYRCSQCRRAFEAEGSAVRCPECGSFLVDLAGGASPEVKSEEATVATERPKKFRLSEQLYEGEMLAQVHAHAARRVQLPAILLMLTAILGIAIQGYGLISLWGADLMNDPQVLRGAARYGDDFLVLLKIVYRYHVAVGIFWLLLSVLVLYGAVKMRRLEGFFFAKTAALLALIPCISPCCLIGLPAGAWALLVLGDHQVRVSFRG